MPSSHKQKGLHIKNKKCAVIYLLVFYVDFEKYTIFTIKVISFQNRVVFVSLKNTSFQQDGPF